MKPHPALVVLMLTLLIGCNSEHAGLVPVKGTVTFRGESVKKGTVFFYPSKGRPASGMIESDGAYSLTTYEKGDGALPGTYRVTVTAYDVVGGSPPPTSLEEEFQQAMAGKNPVKGKVVWIVPEKYSHRESSSLEAVVEASDNTIDFNLE